jgi:hypothetical protein
METTMSKISLALAVALIGGSVLAPAAEAGCGSGHGGYGYSSRSYSSSPSNLYARRKAVAQAQAKAKAQAAARSRALAAKRDAAAARINVAKAETSPVVAIPNTPVASKAPTTGAVTTAALTPTPIKVTLDADKSADRVSTEKAASAGKPICRKFSAAVGGLIEVPCE